MADFLTDEPVMVLHEWLRVRIGLPWSTDFRALARVVDGEIVGCVGFEGFNGRSVRLHMAGARSGWITREFIQRAFRYPFVTLDLPMVFGVVPSGNTTALEIDRRLGFKELLYIPGAHADGGLHFLQLTRDDWMRSKYGKQSTRSA
jgi:RimJ/RimL family protein N-acetyltransferase